MLNVFTCDRLVIATANVNLVLKNLQSAVTLKSWFLKSCSWREEERDDACHFNQVTHGGLGDFSSKSPMGQPLQSRGHHDPQAIKEHLPWCSSVLTYVTRSGDVVQLSYSITAYHEHWLAEPVPQRCEWLSYQTKRDWDGSWDTRKYLLVCLGLSGFSFSFESISKISTATRTSLDPAKPFLKENLNSCTSQWLWWNCSHV